MRGPIRRYAALPQEKKIVLKATIGLCFSAALACGKLLVGLFTDYNLVSIAVYTLAILLAKAECILGIKSERRTFLQRNRLIAIFLGAASAVYVGFMCRMFWIERRIRNNGMVYSLLVAFISFCELGFALAGLFRTKDKGHFYRDIKIIDLCVAFIAILTTQMTLLNLQSETGVVHIFNAYSGIGVGCFIALCAVYILIAPRTSVVGREHGKFVLRTEKDNRTIDMGRPRTEIVLCRSYVYGDYVYRAAVEGDTVEGDIGRGPSLWKRMHPVWKILCCILSEILIFAWLAGRLVLFFRSMDLPARLERTMNENGFVKLTDA